MRPAAQGRASSLSLREASGPPSFCDVSKYKLYFLPFPTPRLSSPLPLSHTSSIFSSTSPPVSPPFFLSTSPSFSSLSHSSPLFHSSTLSLSLLFSPPITLLSFLLFLPLLSHSSPSLPSPSPSLISITPALRPLTPSHYFLENLISCVSLSGCKS